MPSTFDLIRQSSALIVDLEAPEGADPDVVLPAIAEWIEVSGDKLGAIFHVRSRLEAEAARLKGIEAGIAAERKRAENQAERLRQMATALLVARAELGEEPKARGDGWTVRLNRSESVSVPDDAALLPAPFCVVKTTYSADKRAIKAAFDAGEPVPGCAIVVNAAAVFAVPK